MKTIKVIFSIALLSLAVTAFSQRFYSSQEDELEFVEASYTLENSRIADRVGGFLEKFSKPWRRPSPEPRICMSFTLDHPDVVYEEVYQMESWMTAPFIPDFTETPLNLESWMGIPFKCNFAETEQAVESWMTEPFIRVESSEVEEWMTTAWL